MRFFGDHCVPEAVAVRLEEEGHAVLRLRDEMATSRTSPTIRLAHTVES